MPASTPRGYTYLTADDPNDMALATQRLAEQIDGDVQQLDDRLPLIDCGVARWPAATAAKHSMVVAFTKPFPAAPIVGATPVGDTDNVSNLGAYAHSVTSTGMTVVLYHLAGTAFATSGRTVHWSATEA